MRRYDPEKHDRRSIRLKGYDYRGPGAYYVTINAQNKACLFGDVVDGEMVSNDAGRMIEAKWHALPARFPTVQLDAFVVMPNHIHGIIVLNDADSSAVGTSLVDVRDVGDDDMVPTRGAPTDVRATSDDDEESSNGDNTEGDAPPLGDVVGAFKSLITVAYARGVKQNGWPPFAGRLWQRNYYEHVVRDDDDLNRIRLYIAGNPARWDEESENPTRQSDSDFDA